MFHASDLCLALDYVRVKDFHIIVAACNAETYHLLCFLWVTLARKSTKFGSRYLGQRSSEWDEILQVARGGWCTHHPLAQSIPLGSQNIEGCKKKFCNAFLQGGFTDLDEIWHDEGGFKG